jgi:hypothetical protein
MTSKHIINCPCCFKIFKKKACYEKHIFSCERTHSDKPLPSSQQLYDMIQCITEKYNLIQSELETLKKHMNIKNKKLNVLDWLNEHDISNTIDFVNVIQSINIDEHALNCIFENGYIDGVFEIINNHFQIQCEKRFIKCFQQKKNIIYMFHGTQWQVLSNEEFVKVMNGVNIKIFAAFNEYRDANILKFDNDEFQIKFNNNFQKVLCANIAFETRCLRIKNKLYTEMNECFKSIIELQID